MSRLGGLVFSCALRRASLPLLTGTVIYLMLGCQPTNYQALPLDSALGSAEPHLATGPNGQVVLSYLEPAGDGVALRFATLSADRWREPRTVAQGSTWLVNWADFPSVVPLDSNRWAAHWLVESDRDAFAYDAFVAQSSDGGQSWGEPVKIHTDDTATEHGFVSLFPTTNPSGAVGAIWLDGREFSARDALEQPHTQLRSAVIRPDLSVLDQQVVDAAVCDCCQTDVAAIEKGVIAAYRNRTSEEIRDIYTVRNINGLWEQPLSIADDKWIITGCPVNGPAISASQQLIAVAWFTAQPDNRIQVAFSTNSGGQFDNPINVGASQPLGRVDVIVLNNGDAVVSWLEQVPGTLVARRVAADGTLGKLVNISPMQTQRNAGFPQMEASGDWLIFAWTDIANGQSRIKSARQHISTL